MPKIPILSRNLFFDVLNDGSFRDLDLAVVNTSLGQMVEFRPATLLPVGDRILQVDVVDASFNSRKQMDEDKFFSLFNSGGRALPIDFDY